MNVDVIFPSASAYLGVALVLVLAQAVYVAFGFGAGLIAVGGLALLLPQVTDVVVVLMLLSIPAELWVVCRSRREVAWGAVVWIGAGLGVGVIAGSVVLARGAPGLVLPLLGAVLIGSGVTFLALPGNLRVGWSRGSQPLVGLISGLLAGLFGVGGPPLVVYFQLARTPKALFRAQLMAIFLLTGCVRLPAYIVEGLVTLPRLASALALLPAALLGAYLGHRVHLELSERRFRQLVSVSLCVIGALILLRSA